MDESHTTRTGKDGQAYIHRLPMELIMEIWLLVLLSPTSHGRPGLTYYHSRDLTTDYYPRLHTLAQVCLPWANCIRQSPCLWVYVHSCDSWYSTSRALAKSQDLPLTVMVKNFHLSIDLAYNEDRIGQFSNHIHRWEDVSLEFPTCTALERRLATSPAPRLRRLRIISHGAELDSIFGGQTPALRHLELGPCSVRRRTEIQPLIQGLRSLELCDQGRPFSLTELLMMLGACPDLVGLVLDRLLLHGAREHLQPVVLPSLRKLALLDANSHTITSILSYVVAPRCDSLDVTWHGIISTYALSALLPHMLTLNRSNPFRGLSIDLDDRVYINSEEKAIREGEGGFFLVLDIDDMNVMFRWIATVLVPALSGTAIRLIISPDFSRSLADITSSIDMSFIRSLEFSKGMSFEMTNGMLDILSKQTYGTKDGRPMWILLGLEELSFPDWEAHSSAVRTLQQCRPRITEIYSRDLGADDDRD